MDRDGEVQLTDTGSWVGLPGLDAGPVDHAWLENGHGVLSCVAGHRHAPDAVAVCPFYLRADVVDQTPDSLRVTELPVPLRYRDRPYFKLTALVRPEHWHEFVASLPARHGLPDQRVTALVSLPTPQPDRRLPPHRHHEVEWGTGRGDVRWVDQGPRYERPSLMRGAQRT